MLYILQTGYAYVIINTVLNANSGTKSKGKSPVDGATGDFFILVFKSLRNFSKFLSAFEVLN